MANKKTSKKQREELVDKICSNIEFYCPEEEVQKKYGKIEDVNQREFVTKIFEYIHEIKERNEEMKSELDFRETLLDYYDTMVIAPKYEKSLKQEVTRTKDICASLKTAIELNTAKIEVFEKDIVKDILDSYALIGRLNILLGNPLGLGEYNALQEQIRTKNTEFYNI